MKKTDDEKVVPLKAKSGDDELILIETSKSFVEGFTPPDYSIDGMLRRRFAYSFTGRTGDGKTAVMLRIASHVVRGVPLGKYAVEKGRVLYLAGENPDDVRMRWMAMAHEMNFDPAIARRARARRQVGGGQSPDWTHRRLCIPHWITRLESQRPGGPIHLLWVSVRYRS